MGNKKKKLGKNRLDKFYYMAKEQGYRARAAFKLIQLNKKYDFLSKASNGVLDLCAAPGSWLQVCAKFCPASCKMIGVDLASIKPIRNCHLLQEDITTPKCRLEITKILGKNGKVDVVLHDGAPKVGTQWNQDAFSQAELTLHAFRLATEFLSTGGVFVTKVFRSGDYNALLWVLKQFFRKVEANKPPASRNASAEIFVVCQGYMAPKKIDPKIFDPREVFKTVDQVKKADLMSSKKRKPNKEGYEEGAFVLFKKASIYDFVVAEDAIRMLSECNQFFFDDNSEIFKEDPATTSEIFSLCEDLKVLGKSDLKHLLKWRHRMRTLIVDEDAKGDESSEEKSEKKEENETEENLEEEISTKIEELKKREKKKLKKMREQKKKSQRKIDLKMAIPGDYIEQKEKSVFELSSLENASSLNNLVDADPDFVIENDEDEEIDHGEIMEKEYDGNYSDYLEEFLDDLYEKYESGKRRKKRKVTVHDEMTLDDLPGVENEIQSDSDGEPNDDDRDENPLIVKDAFLSKKSTDITAKRWFSQTEFQGIDEDEEDDEEYLKKLKSQFLKKNSNEFDNQNQESTKEVRNDQLPPSTELSVSPDETYIPKTKNQKDDTFEEVTKEEISDFSDEEDEALAMAIGNAMVNKRISKEELEDFAFNKYAFNDHELVPKWFADEESKHNQKQMPVTKAEVDEAKLKFKLINATPIKKVAEAKAKKKVRLSRQLEKLKKQTEALIESNEMSSREKAVAIEQIYKKQKALTKERVSTTYLVAKKSGGKVTAAHKGKQVGKRKVKKVDRRMKKDLRAQKAKDKKKKGKNSSKRKSH